jgi:hypothetical protein
MLKDRLVALRSEWRPTTLLASRDRISVPIKRSTADSRDIHMKAHVSYCRRSNILRAARLFGYWRLTPHRRRPLLYSLVPAGTATNNRFKIESVLESYPWGFQRRSSFLSHSLVPHLGTHSPLTIALSFISLPFYH